MLINTEESRNQTAQLQVQPQINKNIVSQKTDLLAETILQQQIVIDTLKKQIQKLHIDLKQEEKAKKQVQNLYNKAIEQINSQNQKIETLKQNNQSIIHTFQAFQRQFVKRDYKNGINIHIDKQKSDNTSGPFFLQLVRNMKLKFNDHNQQQNKEKQMPNLNQYYGYFFNQQQDQKDSQLYVEINEQKHNIKSIKNKIISHGKKSFFSEKYRKLIWYNIIHDSLRITEQLYKKLCQKSLINQEGNNQSKISLIDRDLNRMDLKLDDDKGKIIKASIKKCLQAFQIYRPDIGYVQGMSYLAWMFVIRMNEFQAFSCFSNLILCDPFVQSLYFFKEKGIKNIQQFFQKCLQSKKPKLFRYLKNLQVQFDLFIIQWAYTMFSRAFSLRISSKIWDLWFCQGFKVFFKVCLVILQMMENQILQINENDKIIQFIRSQTHKLDQLQFLKILRKQKIPEDYNLNLQP